MEIKNKKTISIVGAGRLGGALAIALARKGYKIEFLAARNLKNIERVTEHISTPPEIVSEENLSKIASSDVVLIATQDPEIKPTALTLAASLNFKLETVFLHTSGSLSSAVLQDLREKGAAVCSMHPLVSVSDSIAGAARFAGAFFCVEGDAAAVEAAKQIVADLGGESFEINAKFKTLYHAAAVMAAGHLVALFDVAAETLSDCGVEKNEARRILLPLARSALENLAAQTPAAALTGTFARADLETMRRHLESFKSNPAGLRVYAELGKRSIELAREHGANGEKLDEMFELLS